MARLGSEGNTKIPRISASIYWVFTINNWKQDHVDAFIKSGNDGSIKYVFQEEIGESGTPHLQGFIQFSKKQRPLEFFGFKDIHWEKCKDIKASIAYCSKADTATGKKWIHGIKIEKPIKTLADDQLYTWQKDILEVIQRDPDDRTIHWYWEPVGNCGKSAFAKYLAIKYDAMILSGKGSDCKYAICKWYETKNYYPEIIVYDIPRVMNDYISYDALESIKNGVFFSGKYEACQVIMNSPHIICFSNQMPELDKMSIDRWNVTKIM